MNVKAAASTVVVPDDPARARHATFVTVVLPCLNEEEAVADTVREALRGLTRAGVPGEVLVVDNGSTDRSVELATGAGARVVHETRRGYGAAHLAGIAAARGDAIVMADADLTYDLENLGQLIARLEHGADLVVANRFGGKLDPRAMPWLHRHVGTPVITRFVKTVTRVPVDDSQSGYRAFWKDSIETLKLRTPGMEYASEMLLRAGSSGLRVDEIPSVYRERVGESKLDTFGDGWRHLRLLLILSPHLSLMLPGALLLVLGFVLCSLSFFSPTGVAIGSFRWLPVFAGPTALILGAQGVFLGALAAHQSEFTPHRIRAWTGVLDRKNAVDHLLWRFLLVAVAGVLVDLVLAGLYLADQSGSALVGLAGIAQALIVIGVSGIVTVIGADFARRSLTR